MRAALAVFIALLMSAPAFAQSPDQAPHRTTEHFRFFGDEDVHNTLERLAGIAEGRFDKLCAPIGACDRLTKPIDVWVAADPETFAASFPGENPMSEWAAGVTFLKEQRVVLRRHGSAVFTLDETFDHEVAHVLAHTFDAGTGRLRRLPRWFHEGLAIWQSGENTTNRLLEAQRAAATGNLVTFAQLNDEFPNEGGAVGIAYAQSALFVQRLARAHGPRAIAGLLHDVADGKNFAEAFEERFGGTPEALFTTATDELEETSSLFSLFSDGNLIWALITVLFIGVAWWRLRDRKAQMQRLADDEDRRIQAEQDLVMVPLSPPPGPRPDDDPLKWN